MIQSFEPDPSGEVTRRRMRVNQGNCQDTGGGDDGGEERNSIIYWGMVDGINFSPFDFPWDQPKFDSFLALLNSETGDYRDGTGYPMQTTDFAQFAWFLVPDSYPSPIVTTGFQFGIGIVGTPTGNVLTATQGSDVQANQTSITAPVNGFIGTSSEPVTEFPLSFNGWNYSLVTIGSDAYRAYCFCIVQDFFGTSGYGTSMWNDGLTETAFTLFVEEQQP